jgi:hypothetical protein
MIGPSQSDKLPPFCEKKSMKKRSKPIKRTRAKKRVDTKADTAQPRDFKAHLLAIPQDGGEFERMKIEMKDVDFGEP